MLLLAAAIEQAKAATPEAIASGLKAVSEAGFTGVTGPIKLDDEGQRIDPPYDRLKYEGGGLVQR